MAGIDSEIRMTIKVLSEKGCSKAEMARPRDVFQGFELRGPSQRQMVAELNGLGIGAPRGGPWKLKQIQRLKAKIAA